jgi:N-acetylmuramate 1-kinase
MPDTSATREQQRLEWARQAIGAPHAALLRASTDAGFRSYWRTDGVSPPLIVMDSPPGLEDVGPWLHVRALLDAGGVRVPRVLAEDRARGFLLLEDLGADTLLQVLDAGNADRWFEAALEQLLRLQAIPVPAAFPAYDHALLERELGLFDTWFLQRHLGLQLDHADRGALATAGAFLVERALAQPQVLVHRDYMPRNLMPVPGGVAVLDFQDAVRGPIAYDPTSLFKDAFLSWPAARVDTWLHRYHALALEAGLPVPARARFREDAELIGVQRHLKVLGIFARLHHRDGKPKYLADAPRFVSYLDDVLPRYPALAGLDRLLDRHVRPAFAAGTGATQ